MRRTIEDFLLNEWQMGALLGDKPEKAYFVKCDRSTMTQNDLDNGRLVCLIGVAAAAARRVRDLPHRPVDRGPQGLATAARLKGATDMAVLRDRPYVQFNFLVDLGDGNTDGPEAGFQECSNLGMEVTVAEYRNGNEKENSVRKITGLNKATDVTLKRGVIGSLNLYHWLDQIRNGDQTRTADRHDPAPERGPHRGRADLEAAARADHQARQRPVQRQGHRRRDGGADARLRAAGDGVARVTVACRHAGCRASASSASAPASTRVLPRMDVAAFVGFAASRPARTRRWRSRTRREFAALFGGDAPLAWDAARAASRCAPTSRRPCARSSATAAGAAGSCALRAPVRSPATSKCPGWRAWGPRGSSRRTLRARSEGSWADGLRVATTLQSATLALVEGDGARFTFAVSRPGDVAPGDLIRLTSDEDILIFAVESVLPAPLASPLSGDRRARVTATALPGSVVRLLREPPIPEAAGKAVYRDDSGTRRTADASVAGPSLTDRLALDVHGPAPAEGSLLSVDLPGGRVWMAVDEVRTSSDPDAVLALGALARPADATPAAYGPARFAERLTFELLVRRGATESWRLADLGFAPGHRRHPGDLPTDLDLLRNRDGEPFEPAPDLWSAAAAPRFPLAGHGAEPALLLPLGRPFVPSGFAGPRAPDRSGFERDGLEPFDERVFLDDALGEDGTRTLLASADALRYHGDAPRALRGIHALLGVDEATIVAVPDAVQPRWEPAEVQRVTAPDAIPPRFRPEWWRFLPCTPAPPEDPAAVAISEHYLCASERLTPAPELSAGEPERGGLELSWTPVGVAGATTYVLEESAAPDWSDATVAYRGAASHRRLPARAGTRYHRVRAEAGAQATDWSNPVTVKVDPPRALAVAAPVGGHFLACDTLLLKPPRLSAVEPTSAGSFVVRWSPSTEPGAEYVLEEALRPDWSDARELYRGPKWSVSLHGRSAAVYYYRVRAVLGDASSDWSVGIAVRVDGARRWEREPVDAYRPDTLLTVQRALMRMCAARGDLFAVLGLPAHYREDDAITHAHTLSGHDPLDDDLRTRSFAALYHPWLTAPEGSEPGAFRLSPPDGAAAGVMARRAAGRGAWVAPANEPLRDVVALTPRDPPGGARRPAGRTGQCGPP